MSSLRRTLFTIVLLSYLGEIISQQRPETSIDPQVVIDIFGPAPNVSSTTVPGAPIYIGGDGLNRGDCICVPYYNCDENKVLKLDGETDGFGVIDIRFGKNKCSHYLDLCCTYPDTSPVGPNPIDPNPVDPIPVDPIPVDPIPVDPIPVEPPVTPSTHKPLPPVSVTPPYIPETPPPTLRPEEKVLCGIRNPNGVEFNIQGNSNREAEYGEFPWMVAILRTNWVSGSDDNLSICGGSLIHPQVVLTGAHCVHNLHSTDLKIRAGEWDTQTTKERYPYQERNVEQILIHKDFSKEILLNDIALLVLSSPVQYAANVKTVCLPEQGYVYNHKECYASGWGKRVFGREGSPSVILKKIDLPIVPHKQCEDSLRKTRLGKFFQLHRSFLCAGGIAGKDTLWFNFIG